MRAIFMVLLCVCTLFSYEIRHENEGKIYKFTGDANGEKFEFYITNLSAEFENFNSKDALKIPPKMQGHLFFKGSKFEFSKGEIVYDNGKILQINALSEWLNLSIKREQGDKFEGKLAIKGKAMKATAKKVFTYETLVLASQTIDSNKTRTEVLSSDYFGSKFKQKYKNTLSSRLDELRSQNKNAISSVNLEYQNDKIRSSVTLKNDSKFCSTVKIKDQKKLKLKDVFKSNDQNLTSENFMISPLGISFCDEEKTISIEEIKPYLKENFGLLDE